MISRVLLSNSEQRKLTEQLQRRHGDGRGVKFRRQTTGVDEQ